MLARILLFAVATAAPGQLLSNPQAQEKFREAQEAFAAEDFDAAAKAVEAAYFIEPKPMLLYPWAQAERSRGDCGAAVELYERFLATDPVPQLADAARENKARCEEQLAAAAGAIDTTDDDLTIEDDDDLVVEDDVTDTTEPTPPVEPTPAEPASTPNDTQPKAKAWYLDPVGGVLSGVGIAGVATGVALLVVSKSTADGVADQDSQTGYQGEIDRATGLRNGGAAALSIGGALLVGGVVRYLLVAKKRKSEAAAWHLAPQLRTRWVGVSFGARF